MRAETLSLLLHDTAALIRPRPVAVIADDPPDSHPNRTPVVLALSDLVNLFSSTSRPSHSHVTHKLRFYAANALSTPPALLAALADELVRESRRREGSSDPG